MRRLFFAIALVPLVACGYAFAGEDQAQNPEFDGSQKVQKLASPGQTQRPQKSRQAASTQPGRRPVPRPLPLSAAEAYAAGHSASPLVSSKAAPASPPTDLWTGFYVGAGAGVAR